MTEVSFPHEPTDVSWRGRLQRRLRRQRRDAVGHAAIGAIVAALVVLGSGLVPEDTPAEAQDTDRGTAAGDAPVFTAAMVGDLMFGRHVERVTERRGVASLLEPAQRYLEADYVSGNLEQVVSGDDDLPEADKLIHLRSGSEVLDALVGAGFTTLSLANNHTMDHGIPGLRDTIEALDAAGIAHAGAGVDLGDARTVDLQEHGDLTVATLSFTDVFVEGFIARSFQGGVLQAEPEVMVPLVQQARQDADLVLVHVHWGREYDLRPSARQRELAEVIAAAGADIIVGHHPHVLLPVEVIDDTLVFFSLGNFVFDQGWSRTRESVIARYALREDGSAQVELVPVYLREATPRVVSGPTGVYRRERIFQRLRGDGLDWQRDGDRLVADLPPIGGDRS